MRIPADFLHQDWNQRKNFHSTPACLGERGVTCDAFLLNLSNEGGTDIVILNDLETDVVFAKDADGLWRVAGRPGPHWTCLSVVKNLRSGNLTIHPAAVPRWREVSASGVDLTVLPTLDEESRCPD